MDISRSGCVLAVTLAAFLAASAAETSASLIVGDAAPITSLSADGPASAPFTFLGGKWNPGTNAAQGTVVQGPGDATWSIMGAGFSDVSGFDPNHIGTSVAITALAVPGFLVGDYEALIDSALDVWASVSEFTSLGMVADGGVNVGASEASGGVLGDIRIAAWEISTGTTLAHAFEPGNESTFGPGGSIGGDVHLDVNRIWRDDPTDTTGDSDFDLFTVVLHELGHSLGLGHSTVSGSVMQSNYAGARRTLQADDIAGIQAIYGAATVAAPEPSSFVLLGVLGLGFLSQWRLRRRDS